MIRTTPPWFKHKFPVKRITRVVVTAKRRYRCETMGPTTDGHAAAIQPGEKYLKVNLKPHPGVAGWRTRRFCLACALHFELVEEVEI